MHTSFYAHETSHETTYDIDMNYLSSPNCRTQTFPTFLRFRPSMVILDISPLFLPPGSEHQRRFGWTGWQSCFLARARKALGDSRCPRPGRG